MESESFPAATSGAIDTSGCQFATTLARLVADRIRPGWLVSLLAFSAASGIIGRAAEVRGSEDWSPAVAGYTMTHWTVEDGLPMQNVTALAQTTNGFLWCGTADGLVRFDGLEFKVYLPHEVAELEGFQIRSLHADGQGRLWIIDEEGRLAVYEQGGFRRLTGEAGRPIVAAGVIRESPTGELWLLGWNDGSFHRFRTNHLEQVALRSVRNWPLIDFHLGRAGPDWGIRRSDEALLQYSSTGAEEHPLLGAQNSEGILGRFFELEGGTLGLTSSHGIYAYEEAQWVWRPRFDVPISHGSPLDGCRDRRGNIWVGTRGGGLVLSSKDGHLVRVNLPGEIPGMSVNALIQGREGNIWAGTSAGLYRISLNPVKTISAAHTVSNEAVQSLAEASDGRLWVAGANRLHWLESKTETLSATTFAAREHKIWRITSSRDGALWLGAGSHSGTEAEIWRVTPETSTREGIVRTASIEDLLETSQGELLVAMTDGLFHRLGQEFPKVTLPAEIKDRKFNALAEDHAGRIYAAVAGVGLFRRERGEWHRLTQRTDPGSERIHALCLDEQNTLWLAAERPGLARWKDEQWSAIFSAQTELPRRVRAVAVDDQGGLWLASRWGVVRADRAELDHRAEYQTGEINSTWFDTDEGLPSIDCAPTKTGICKDRHGRIWIATARGVAMVDPAGWKQQQRSLSPPPVLIEQVAVDDTPVKPTTTGRRAQTPVPHYLVPAHSQRIEIQFTGINLTAPEKMRFRYRLEGFDDAWVNLAGPRMVHFTRLPPGEYRFQLVAISNEGVQNREGAVLALTVQPPWWQRTSVRAGAGLGFLGLLWLGVHIRLRRLQRVRAMQSEFSRQLIHSQEQERKHIAGELHDSLGQHLLVAKNLALTGVNTSKEAPAIAKLFGDISETVSAALSEARAISKELRPPELDRMGLTKALRGMIQRAGESSGINCQVILDDIDGLLPAGEEINLYRLVQEGMNNIVKHSQAARAEITVRHEPDHLAVSVADNGRGFDAARVRYADAAHLGTGITGMEERSRLMGGEFEISSQPGGGTCIRIRIPVKAPQP